MGEHDQETQARERFRLVYDATYRHVLAYALRRTVCAATADDVVAETFLIAWRRWPVVPPGEEALPWLYGVARRVLANQRRGEDRQLRLLHRVGAETSAPVDVEWEVVTREVGRRALAALRRLSDEDQEILRLVAWERLSHRQIATVLGCSENAVAVRVHRARTRLRRHMEEEVVKGESVIGHIKANPALREGGAS